MLFGGFRVNKSGGDRIAAAFIVGALLGAGCMYVALLVGVMLNNWHKELTIPITESETLSRSMPTHISIPELGIEAEFEAPVGVSSTGELEVPEGFDTVAWYEYGPTPGEKGPAVVLGHVDSYVGPEIFHQLWRLKPGDEIEILREDGKVAVFEVLSSKEYPQSQFPFEEVYGDIDHAGLRLITCSGSYDHGAMRYSHNLIVFAALTRVEAVA